ncbi:MAG: ABC transporter ATP-binding protein [Chloroflexota bacterium]
MTQTVARLPIFKGMWSLIRFRPGFFMVNLIFVVFYYVSQLIPGLIIQRYLDTLTSVNPAVVRLVTLLGLLLLVELLRMVSIIIGDWGSWKTRGMAGILMIINVVANVLRKPGAEPLPVPAGDAINRLDRDLADFADYPTWLPELFGYALFFILALIIMARINLPVTLVAVVPLIAVFFINRFTWTRFLHYDRQSRVADSEVTSYLGEIFGAVQAVKVAGAEGGIIHHLTGLSERRRQANVRKGVFYSMMSSITDSLGEIAVAVMVLLLGQASAAGLLGDSFTVGDFALFTTYLFLAAQFPGNIGMYLSETAQQRVVLDRLQEITPDASPESLVQHRPVYEDGRYPPVAINPKTEADRLALLEVNGLTYRYRTPGRDAYSGGIKDVSFTVPRGSFTVITGRVGTGKTTLLRSLLGLLPSQAGTIRWNGEAVADPALFFRPPHSAYTPQVLALQRAAPGQHPHGTAGGSG